MHIDCIAAHFNFPENTASAVDWASSGQAPAFLPAPIASEFGRWQPEKPPSIARSAASARNCGLPPIIAKRLTKAQDDIGHPKSCPLIVARGPVILL
jgi:hypothetical protein